MMTFDTAQLTCPWQKRCQDRAEVVPHPQGIVAVVSDGAGGVSGGAEAAGTVAMWVKACTTRTSDIRAVAQWGELLAKLDQQLMYTTGQATAVVVAVHSDGLAGASVGDSAAWLIGSDGYDDLTASQTQKPLLGSGGAKPKVFERPAMTGTLLLASDGLVKYASPARICELARLANLRQAAEALVDAVRLRSGALQDDVGIILCRRAEPKTMRMAASRPRYRLTPEGDLLPESDEDG
jgi:serine/threonine protein phosphatase PrpC